MDDLALLLVLAAAAYRLTRIVTRDTLPLFARPREALLRRWTANKATDWKAEGLLCGWCVGAWLSTLVVLAADLASSVPLPGLMVLAVSSGVGFLGLLDQ